MIDSARVKKVLYERINSNAIDEFLEPYWDELFNLLKDNEKETIEFLKTCNGKEMSYLCEIFEKLYEHFHTRDFVEGLIEIARKNKEVSMGTKRRIDYLDAISDDEE